MCAVRAQGRIAALDQGTTSSRAVVFDSETVKIECIKNHQLTQYYPHPAWVEQDPQEIWRTQLDSLTEACESAGLPLQRLHVWNHNSEGDSVVWKKITEARI